MILPPYLALVDDDTDVTRALKRLLRHLPMEVRVFNSGREFLTIAVERRPEAAILDVHMPDLGGFDVQERLVAAGSKVPIIFITAFDDRAIRGRALERGAVGFIAKPFDRQKLLELVSVALREAPDKPPPTRLRLQSHPSPTAKLVAPTSTADFELADLEACPFCQAYPRLDKISWVDSQGRICCQARVVCPRCNAQVSADPEAIFGTATTAASDAMRRWNRRAVGRP